MAWHRVASADEIRENEPLAASVEGREIGLYRIGEAVYAVEDVCPHAYALLSSGFVDGEEVECPLHEAKFHIPSGRCLKAPADRDLATYKVRIEGDAVMVEV